MVGTNNSTGCPVTGAASDHLSAVVGIDWLNGRAKGYDEDGNEVVADWHNGRTGMIGKSYDGTLANGVAATGVKGLKTIVPISAISSWYDYTRSGGVPYSDDYMPWLAGYVGHDSAACDEVRGELGDNDDDETGDYTSFWSERDYTKNASKVQASVFKRLRAPSGRHDASASTEQALGHQASEARGCTRDEPVFVHRKAPFDASSVALPSPSKKARQVG
jgi:X-Pro dipeptidyl-peptidase